VVNLLALPLDPAKFLVKRPRLISEPITIF
jgi:hypothetical protein